MEGWYLILTILAIIILVGAFIPAEIAKKKGHSFGFFYTFGIFFWLPALIVSLCVRDNIAEQKAQEERERQTEILRQQLEEIKKNKS
jgi:Na+/melibiose symporter-like transporter